MDNTINFAHFSNDYKHIIDSDGNKLNFDDPRVVHILPISSNTYTTEFMANFLEKGMGWNVRQSRRVTPEIFEYSKKLCSGRECLSFHEMTAHSYSDILTNRKEDEVSVYYGIEQEGPCQCAAWPLIWESFMKRLSLKNVIVNAHAHARNKYLGKGGGFGSMFFLPLLIGDLLEEAKSTLECLAVNVDEALKIFDTEAEKIIQSSGSKNAKAIEKAVSNWADAVSKIPLKAKIEETPRILIFGGGVVPLIHHPLKDFYIKHGIIPKIIDQTEFILHIESEPVRRYGFRRGLNSIKEASKIFPIIFSYFNKKNNPKESYASNAIPSVISLTMSNNVMKKYRKIADKSGLLHDVHVSFQDIIKEGHEFVNHTLFSETTEMLGRFVCSLKYGNFDGIIHVASFNCQPSITAQSMMRPIANNNDIPFAGIELEGPWISTNHYRLLETIAVQAKSMRKMKNEKN